MDTNPTAESVAQATRRLPVLLAVEAKAFHVHKFARIMRQADRDEVLAMDGMRPAQVLHHALRQSLFARAIFIGPDQKHATTPLAMFGVINVENGWTQPWCLTTVAADRYPVTFWRASKLVMRELRKVCPAMRQCIDARHVQALAWIKRLGFDVEPETHPCGVQKIPCYRVTLVTRSEG